MKWIISILFLAFAAKAEVVELPKPTAYILHGWSQDGGDKLHVYGTAFFIASHTVLTCAHNMNKDRFELIDGEKRLPVTCVKCDEEMDIAVLHCDEDRPAFECVKNDAKNVKVFGSPRGGFIREFNATADHIQSDQLANRILHAYRSNADHGCSGAPCLYEGKVMGMFQGIVKDSNICALIPYRRIEQFLSEK